MLLVRCAILLMLMLMTFCQCLVTELWAHVQASSVRLYWNASGTALLAITASDVDVTNQSYYGEQKIHYLAADGSNDCLVPSLKVKQICLTSPHALWCTYICNDKDGDANLIVTARSSAISAGMQIHTEQDAPCGPAA